MRAIAAMGVEEFLRDENAVDAAERNLLIAVEALIDVGEALIAYEGWRTPRSYREVCGILEERGVLTPEDRAVFEEAVKLRNILVHNYTYVEPRRLHRVLTESPENLTKIMGKLLDYMAREGIDP